MGTHSSPVLPLPSFGFTLAATGPTLSISMFSSAEYSVWEAVWNSLVGLKTVFALRLCLGVVAGEQGLEFHDDLQRR